MDNLKKICSEDILHRRIPILTWLPRYSSKDAVSDMIAGITVALTMMPQAIAYAALAGLGPQYGLYSALSGSFIYIILGTCKEVSIGPTALLSLLTFNYTHDTNPEMAVLLCFLVGCIELLCGILRLGFLVEFVSAPVVAGFTSASALIIATTQVKGLLGLKFQSENFIETLFQIFTHIDETRLWDAVLGFTCIIILLLLRKLKDHKISNKEEKSESAKQNILKQLLFYICNGRNAMVVFICAAVASSLTIDGTAPFLLIGKIESGLPQVKPPPFYTSFNNSTLSFVDMCQYLGSGLAVIPFVAILENVAIAKTFSTGQTLDGTQEMITLGLSNIVGSFFQSIPTTGAFSRSAVNHTSGVRTTLGGLYTGVMMILALSLLTPYFYYIPKATLSAVIISAVIFMIEVQILPKIWNKSRIDLIPACVSFLVCLSLSVEMGIIAGVAVDVVLILYSTARPKIEIEHIQNFTGLEYILITPKAGLLFPAIDYIKETIKTSIKYNTETDMKLPIVFNGRHIKRMDFTAFQGIQTLTQDLSHRGHHIIFHETKPKIIEVLNKSSPSEFLWSTNDIELIHIIKDLQMKDLNTTHETILSLEDT